MFNPGDVVKADFRAPTGIKRRPVVVVSSALYHQQRPDLILSALDHEDRESHHAAGLRFARLDGRRASSTVSVSRYLSMDVPAAVTAIGRLSDRDWQNVQLCLARAFGLPPPP